MKKSTLLFFLLTTFFVSFSVLLFSQNSRSVQKDTNLQFDEQGFRKAALADGVHASELDKIVADKKLFYQNLRNQALVQDKKKDIDKAPLSACDDMGGENGWGGWRGRAGTIAYNSVNITWGPFSSPPPPSNANTGFYITTGAGTDNCTPSGGGPAVPVVAPGFGNASIQLGVPHTPNGYAEQLEYSLNVTPQDTDFIYTYAIFLDNPADGNHVGVKAPHAEIYMLGPDPTTGQIDTVPCSHRIYYGSNDKSIPPGFFIGACPRDTYPNAYRPWTIVGVNLSKYVGKNITITINNVDCALGGHFCHSYWDFKCGVFNTNPGVFCAGSGQAVTITAPQDPLINYTYQWYKNTNPYTGPMQPYTGNPNGNAQTIFPIPLPGDTFYVKLIQPSGCNFIITYVPIPLGVVPDFTPSGTCGAFDFDGTAITYPAGTPVKSWDWNFGGGTPNTSNIQNPKGIKYPQGTYTVTLVVTSQDGCTDTIKKEITASGPPVAIPTGNSVCFNNANLFTDNSIGNSTVTNWIWDFGDGSSSTLQNPKHTYATPGVYTVTLMVTNNAGCKDTNKTTVYVNSLPKANFSSTKVCFGNPTCFTDMSTIPSGNITSFSWNFGDPGSGANNISILKDPCHTYTTVGNYSITLTVTSDSGCQSTTILPASFNPPPIALFSSTPVCFNVPTNFVSQSTSSGIDPINTWDWTFGDGTTSNQENPTHIYITSGAFTATLVVTTVAGCKDTIENPVKIYAPPVVKFSKPDSGCTPVIANFNDLTTSADGIITSWQWSFPGGVPSFSNLQNPTDIKYVPEGTYSVSLIATTTYGCTDSLHLPMINVYGWPSADFCVSPTVTSATDPVFNFCDMWSKNVSNWSWNFGDGTRDSTNTDPVHSYSATINQNDFYTQQICLRVATPHGCWDTVCHEVKLIPEFEFYIPNTFTPNGDGVNDMFYGKCRGVKEYDIWLFDRWGNQVWDCHHKDKNINWDSDITNPREEGLSSFCQWDGIVVRGGMDMGGDSGEHAQEDVYVWKVHLIDIFNKTHTYIGHVNIVK